MYSEAFVNYFQSWYEASNSCRSMGGRLATITSPEENSLVGNFAPVSFQFLCINDKKGCFTLVCFDSFSFYKISRTLCQKSVCVEGITKYHIRECLFLSNIFGTNAELLATLAYF
jgi:hypothetical protein